MRGREATIEDLERVEGKAELVGGRLVLMPLSTTGQNRAVLKIGISLHEYGERTKLGYAVPEGGFIVDLPNRRSFSPDVAFATGSEPFDEYPVGAPTFAVEIRSKGDHGRAAERAMAAKRAEYFAAGTLVVWDVDLLNDRLIRVYRASDPALPTLYRRGEHAEAEPALPGWTMPVDDLFPSE